MNARRILGCLLFAVGGLFTLSQIYALLTMPQHPMLPHFTRDYLIWSSIENFGFALPAVLAGFFLLRGRSRFSLWLALLVTGLGLWLFVIREVWLYYVVMPRLSSGYLATHSYFAGPPLWWALARISWHIVLPVMFVLAAVLNFRRHESDEYA